MDIILDNNIEIWDYNDNLQDDELLFELPYFVFCELKKRCLLYNNLYCKEMHSICSANICPIFKIFINNIRYNEKHCL